MNVTDPEVVTTASFEGASENLRTSQQKLISMTGNWKGCTSNNAKSIAYDSKKCPCPYDNYPFDPKVMICAEGLAKRNGKVDGKMVDVNVDKYWNTLETNPETLSDLEKNFRRPMKNKCTGDSGSK